ncbi:hypothetical protein [Mycolicibacterium sp. XJ1819]
MTDTQFSSSLGVVEDRDHDAPPPLSRAAHLARVGIAGLLDPRSRIERLQERRDRDRAHWIGVPTFTRPPTPQEQAMLSSVAGAAASGVRTRVDVRGGLYRRSWPTLVHPMRAS